MGVFVSSPRPPIRPIYRKRLDITLKRTARHCKECGLSNLSRDELLNCPNGPLIRKQDGQDNPAKHIVKNMQVLNVIHKGKAYLTSERYSFSRQGNNADIGQFLNQLTPYLSTLTEFKIDIPWGWAEDVTEAVVTKISRHLTQLRKLRLCFNPFGKYKVDPRTFRVVGKEIAKNLVNLEELGIAHLGASGSESTYDITNNFFHPINKYMRKLTRLKLLFNKFDDDNTLEALGDNLDRGLAGLRHLEIFLCEAEKITTQGFEALSLQVGKHLVNLQSLTFRVLNSKCDETRLLRLFKTNLPHLPSGSIKLIYRTDYWGFESLAQYSSSVWQQLR